MKVSELFTNLSFGVLSNLSMSGEGSGEIQEKSQGKIINYTNNALMRLYSRFVLSEKEVMVELMEGVTSYYLLKRFSQSHCGEIGNEDPLYIMDLLNPFEEDVIKVLQVRDSIGNDLSLNDMEDPLSVFTPSPTLIQVPTIIRCAVLSVNYQARHIKLERGILTQDIQLPDTLHEALYEYIAYQVYSHMNGQDNTAKAQEHLSMYESICSGVSAMDLVSSSTSTTSSVFHQRGWI